MRLCKFILLGGFFGPFAWAEPYLSPNDPFMRHEIRILADEGSFTGLQNTWPLDLGGVLSMRNDSAIKLPHSLLDHRITLESKSGWSPLITTIGLADDRVTARSFSPEPRSSFATNASVSWMNDRFAGKLSLNSFYGMQEDWKGRKDEGLAFDGSYIAARLGNWSASFGQVERWWGPGWDGSLILSTNARPVPGISIDRRMPEPFETKWLSWIGPWSFHSFIGRLEKERTVPHPYLWGMRVEMKPAIIDGLEIGFSRTMQLGGKGRPDGLSTWIDAFLSQDNEIDSNQPGNQLAGIDFRWKVLDSPLAVYGQIVGEDEDKFLPNCLMFQYGMEGWKNLANSTLRIFVEYADLTSYWWTGHPVSRNYSYGHHIYHDGYRYHGRPIGHWADQDSQILSVGGVLLRNDGVGWGVISRVGDLNEDGTKENSVSNETSSDYFSLDIFNSNKYSAYGLTVYASIGWESIQSKERPQNEGISGFISLTRGF